MKRICKRGLLQIYTKENAKFTLLYSALKLCDTLRLNSVITLGVPKSMGGACNDDVVNYCFLPNSLKS